ncbi:hypothetical protein COT95_01410 [Candidatus Falkowbacteria bacterium CG10_big_fil_rev_8_21_14_0_10_37_6]|uniref:Uncharacterized protein n=1 Tax=Candidatus Falkowbacteria bacterium CG10_big_fil_rev_8_21_14_0_10_37_6 TaxID=1974563 RepID=A0A2H0V783_9BACT|nr:MAG: hypothetical protein COT95_01410 [Candidatus Falkowbacteria bacterium CG10_big_fil_rev_8_21_14_0_10_37_6]
MCYECLTDDDMGNVGQVERMSCADDLVYVLVGEGYGEAARDIAAKKIIEMWQNNADGVTSHHLVCVSDYADEPYKSEANKILSSIR